MNDAGDTNCAASAVRYFEGIGIRQERPDEMISSLCQSIELRGGNSKWNPPPSLVVPPHTPVGARLTIVEASGNRVGQESFVTIFFRYRPDPGQLLELASANKRFHSIDSEGLNHCCPAISLKSQLFTAGLKSLLLDGPNAPSY